MRDIRSSIMSRKVQWSLTRCYSCWQTNAHRPSTVCYRRLPVLIGGRLYYRWMCEHCILSMWGVVVSPPREPRVRHEHRPGARHRAPERKSIAAPVPSSFSQTPFGKGQHLAHLLMREGVLDAGMLTHAQACREEAMCYARYVAPFGSPEEVRAIAAGLLYQWASDWKSGR